MLAVKRVRIFLKKKRINTFKYLEPFFAWGNQESQLLWYVVLLDLITENLRRPIDLQSVNSLSVDG